MPPRVTMAILAVCPLLLAACDEARQQSVDAEIARDRPRSAAAIAPVQPDSGFTNLPALTPQGADPDAVNAPVPTGLPQALSKAAPAPAPAKD